jgi:hypothetical protein
VQRNLVQEESFLSIFLVFSYVFLSADQIFFEAENERHLSHWFPILTGLSAAVGYRTMDARNAAVKNLFLILKKYGRTFNTGFWALVFRGVLLPIFDSVNVTDDTEWIATTCQSTMNCLTDIFSDYFPEISFLLSDVLNLLVGFILQGNKNTHFLHFFFFRQ